MQFCFEKEIQYRIQFEQLLKKHIQSNSILKCRNALMFRSNQALELYLWAFTTRLMRRRLQEIFDCKPSGGSS